MNEYKAPQYLDLLKSKDTLKVFLAGSIDMGSAVNWQERVTKELLTTEKYTILNPRRDDWDTTLVQEFENPQFSQQVNWELNYLDKSDIILMVLTEGSKAPISLLELGLYADSGKMLVVCESGFYRKGNVQIVCNRYDIPMFNSIDQVLNYLN